MYKLYKTITTCLVLGALGIPAITSGDVLRDPTKPFTHKDTFTTNISGNNIIKISAIFAGIDHNSVIINNHTFVVGDRVAGLIITAIDKNGITLKNEDGNEFRATMPYSTIKLPTTKDSNGAKYGKENY